MYTLTAAKTALNIISGLKQGGSSGTVKRYLALYADIPSTELDKVINIEPAYDPGTVYEPQGYGYKRALLTTATNGTENLSFFAEPTRVEGTNEVVLKNKGEIHFDEVTTGGNWGTCTHFGIYDKDVGGTLLYIGKLVNSISPTENNVPIIKPDGLIITLKGSVDEA